MKYDLIDLTRQCCDADGYLSLGYRCAQTNACYDELRPIGDALWFSLPYRLGLNEEFLAHLHVLLVLLVGSTLLMLFRSPRTGQLTLTLKIGLFWLLAISVLMLQLWPTFFNALADTPATLLLVAGLLLTLLATQHQQAGLFFVAGIFLGCSALLRAAYFNPLCAAGLVFFIIWVWQVVLQKQKKLRNSIFILSFTLPMTLQFYTTWKNMNEWSFLSKEQTHSQFNDHLNSTVVGYDTLLIESSYYWAPPCTPSKGIWAGINEGNATGLFCLLSNRIYFYLGSYAPHTFYGNENKNFISNGFAEDIGNVLTWSLHNMDSERRAAISPLNDKKASRLLPQISMGETESYFQSSSLIPLNPGTYRYSIWLWTPANQSPTKVDLQFLGKTLSKETLDWKYQSLNQKTIELTDTPKQFFLETTTPTLSYIVTRIGSVAHGNSNITQHSQNIFFAWGAMLETANTSTGYVRSHATLYSPIGNPPNTSGHERIFSSMLLILNLFVVSISFIYLVVLFIKTRNPIYGFIGSLLFLVSAQALMILPEQRFLQGALTMHWILFLLFIYSLTQKEDNLFSGGTG